MKASRIMLKVPRIMLEPCTAHNCESTAYIYGESTAYINGESTARIMVKAPGMMAKLSTAYINGESTAYNAESTALYNTKSTQQNAVR
jgi:hypothetical protein